MNTRDRDTLEAPSREHATDVLRLWLGMLGCTNVIEASLRGAFRREFDSTLPRFDLMSQLDRHPEGLRMGELSKRLMVTSGNITGITDQLVAEGLVTREAPQDDRRAFVVRLTIAGRAAFKRMAERHERWLVELFDDLTPADRKQLQQLLAKLKASAQAKDPSA
jgi:DNA-binding MarR family transcriptional regulator